MEFKVYQILAFLSVALVASHAALPSEVNWNSMLPNSPMPKAVKDLLQPAGWLGEDKSTRVGVSKGGVNVNTGPGKKGGTSVNVGHGSVGVHTGKPGRRTNVGVGKGGVTVGTGTKKGKPVYVGVHPGQNPFNYRYAATQTQLHDNPNIALFFLPKDLTTGKKMNLNFFQTKIQATFLPRKVADSIPFSTDKLPEIFSEFSVNPSSSEAGFDGRSRWVKSGSSGGVPPGYCGMEPKTLGFSSAEGEARVCSSVSFPSCCSKHGHRYQFLAEIATASLAQI